LPEEFTRVWNPDKTYRSTYNLAICRENLFQFAIINVLGYMFDVDICELFIVTNLLQSFSTGDEFAYKSGMKLKGSLLETSIQLLNEFE
jgi:hypothetical protein